MYKATRTVKVPVKKEFAPDLSSTSRARQTLNRASAEFSGAPEKLEAVQKQVSEAYPDLLIDRRRPA